MDIHDALQPLDFAVIVVYLIVLLGIGAWVSFHSKGAQEDLFLGGRTLPWYSVGLSIFGTNIGPSFLIASCSIAYTSGVVGANFEWLSSRCPRRPHRGCCPAQAERSSPPLTESLRTSARAGRTSVTCHTHLS